MLKFLKRMFGFPYWRPNRQSRKMLREEADRLIGYDKTVNPCWKKSSWKYFIKRQYPWYGIIELNQFKIIEMRDYMQNHSGITEDLTQKQIEQMTEVIELGNKILADEYEKAAHEWIRENQCAITIIGKSHREEDILVKLYNRGMFDDFKYNYKLDSEDSRSSKALKRLEDFIKDKDTRSVEEYLADNNLNRKDYNIYYTGEWINGKSEDENEDEFKRRFQKAWDARQKDINKYFKLIAKNMDAWGD